LRDGFKIYNPNPNFARFFLIRNKVWTLNLVPKGFLSRISRTQKNNEENHYKN